MVELLLTIDNSSTDTDEEPRLVPFDSDAAVLDTMSGELSLESGETIRAVYWGLTSPMIEGFEEAGECTQEYPDYLSFLEGSYRGLIGGLSAARKHNYSELTVIVGSRELATQLNGLEPVTDERISKLHELASRYIESFDDCPIRFHPR